MRDPEELASNQNQNAGPEERQRAQQTERWYRAILESSADGILVTDMQGRIQEANQALASGSNLWVISSLVGARHASSLLVPGRG